LRSARFALLAALAACGQDSGIEPPPGPIAQPDLVYTLPVLENYGIHDQFVRDGLAFVSAWNTGLLIYDVGNGIMGGSPSSPRLVGSIVTNSNGVFGGAQVHNAWWFWNPNGEKRYLFVGQEGPGSFGSTSGDIHVVDVSDLTQPAEVGFYHMDGAGTHNFWVDESAQILYAAYYNGGVVAIDISGTLPDTLAKREIARIQPGGPGNTSVWGVQLSNGSIYAADMLSGFWQLKLQGSTFSVAGGGHNVPERYSSDLWVQGGYAYTGTWSHRGAVPGDAVKIWQLDAGGAPVLRDSIVLKNSIVTVSDIEVSPDGKLLMFSAEYGPLQGLHFYSLADPAKPVLVGRYLVPGPSSGIHTATFGTIGGRLYAFAARDPSGSALLIFDVTKFTQ
jgi:hypothetical protein